MSTENLVELSLPRVIIVAGAAYTGSTTVARAIAGASGWRLRSVGGELRQYCERNGLDFATLPLDVHAEVDRQTRDLLASSSQLVIEGRFLSLLSETTPNVFRVQTVAHDRVRRHRCGIREGLGPDWLQASEIVNRRDQEDRALALQLYGRDDYLAPVHYQLVKTNDVVEDVPQIVSAVARLLPGLIRP